jgi:hypothetical protein
MEHLLKPNILGPTPEIIISEEEYQDAKRSREQNYKAFEIELAFGFVVTNYVEIEKYIAEHLLLDMAGQTRSEDAIRAQHCGFIRTLNNWLSSISFWRDLTRSRLISICGRGSQLGDLESTHVELLDSEFVYAFIFHLRNYSQQGGFPVTGATIGGRWDEGRTQLKFSASYSLNYDQIRPYFEQGGTGVKARRKFGKRIQEYSRCRPFDLKPIIRRSLGVLGLSMDRLRASMAGHTSQNESFILELIERFRAAHPSTSVIGLSAMPVDHRKRVSNKAGIVPVRDEFIIRAGQFREQNNSKTLSMEKRFISNE